MVGKSSRDKGRRGEYQVRDLFREAGYKAERVPLSGACGGYPGDITVEGIGIVEVKKGGHVPVALYRWLEGADVLLCRRDRAQWLVVQRWEDWVTSTLGKSNKEAEDG